MSFSETKYLLQKHQILPNKLLGQNFMVAPSAFEKMSDYASLQETDTVLDVGSGFGFLTRYLSERCRKVLAVEKDKRFVSVLREQLSGLNNVQIIDGDVLTVPIPTFNKVVSFPPYQISSHLLLWLYDRTFECAVLVFQKEFANRLIASVGTEDYSWLTVLTHYNAQIELLDAMPKHMFFPQPEVDSVIVRLTKRNLLFAKNQILFKQMLRYLFTGRNKKVANALAPFLKSKLGISAEKIERIVTSIPFRDKRVRTLFPEDFGTLANALLT